MKIFLSVSREKNAEDVIEYRREYQPLTAEVNTST